jgi:peroxiredoxin
MSKVLPAGTVAPGFTLRVTPDQNLLLSDLASKPVALAFYPADWSPVCGDQMALYNEVLPEFHKHEAEVLGISADGAWRHQALAKSRRLHFPLLAGFRTRAVRDRSPRRDLLELPLADCRQSRRRWNPGCLGKNAETGGR